MTRHEKTIRTLTAQWRAALRAEESATDLTQAWKLAARSDAALRRLEMARAGIAPPAPRTRRNLAIGGFSALAMIGRSIARAFAARAALAKAQIANAARRAARSMRLAARRALRSIVLAVIALAPSIALAHPGHDGHDDLGAGGSVGLVGVTLGLAGLAWATWGDKRRALASADSGRPMGGGSAPEPEPEPTPEPEPEPSDASDPTDRHAGSDLECLKPYYTVRVPYIHGKATKWHPTTNVGPFAILTRGCFDTLEAARTWADSHLDGHPYSIVLVTFNIATGDDEITIVHDSGRDLLTRCACVGDDPRFSIPVADCTRCHGVGAFPAEDFGKETTPAACRSRAQWERARAALLESVPYGNLIADGHRRTADAYEARATDLEVEAQAIEAHHRSTER